MRSHFHSLPQGSQGKPDKSYVSEYTQFIEQFLEEHPEALEARRSGRLMYWDRKVDLLAQDKADKDRVPDDGYGFHYSAGHGQAVRKES